MEKLFFKEVSCFENLQIPYCVNYRNIPLATATKEAQFCDSCRNTGRFLCGV